MGIFNKFNKKEEIRENDIEGLLLSSKLDKFSISKEMSLQIPVVSGCTNLISNLIAGLPIKLYQEVNGEVKEVKNDVRVGLLNDETGDILDGFQFKKALVEDFILEGNAYAYINKVRNNVKSLNYIEPKYISIFKSTDPIFKDVKISINGKQYEHYQFINLTRKTVNGVDGIGIIEENRAMLSLAFNTLAFEERNIRTGGVKKGVIKSVKKLTKEALDALKEAWNKLYSGTSENVIVLNDGLDYKELQQTSVELQLNENKKVNDEQICSIFNTPISILKGTATDDTINTWHNNTIIPIINAFESALNKNLLLTKEKGSFYFAFDTRNLTKGDIEKRYKAYEIAIKNKILTVNEVRYEEDKPSIKALENTLMLGLNDVLFNTESKEIYTPNTNASVNLNDSKPTLLSKGGEEDEDRNKE